MRKPEELAGLLLLLLLGLAPRLVFVNAFATLPYSDFRTVVDFGLDLRDHGLVNHDSPWFWESFNPALPLMLSWLFRIAAGVPPAAVARLATAISCGLVPVLPFLLWRGVVGYRTRLAAGVALAVWPGQVLFSGVVAQDNWTLIPTVGLAALAVRGLHKGESGWPVAAGLFYAAGAGIRQEMLIVLLPLLVAAAGGRWRRAAIAAGLPLVALAAFRGAATGRFALTTQHAGVTMLGSYVPGSTANGWTPPYPYIASVRPGLERDRKALLEASGLTLREALRRPGFHALRMVSLAANSAIGGEAGSLYWSVGSPEVLPEGLRARGAAVAAGAREPLVVEMALLQGLFLAAVVWGVRRRNRGILVLAAAVLLKYAIHVTTSALGRHFFPATALEILVIVLAAGELVRLRWAGVVAGGLVFSAVLFVGAPRLAAYVRGRDTDPGQRSYRFFLLPPGLGWHLTAPENFYTELDCRLDHGTLAVLAPQVMATIVGEGAAAECELRGQGEARPLMLELVDAQATRVEMDGEEIGSTGPGYLALGNVGAGTRRRVVIHAPATFRLTRGSPELNLARGKAASESSTMSAAGAAVDGTTDGNFYHGSVTATEREAGAWWQVDLGASVPVNAVGIWNRTDCCAERLEDYWVFLSETPFQSGDTAAVLKNRAGVWGSHQAGAPQPSVRIPAAGVRGRYLRVELSGTNHLSLAEVEVFGDYPRPKVGR